MDILHPDNECPNCGTNMQLHGVQYFCGFCGERIDAREPEPEAA